MNTAGAGDAGWRSAAGMHPSIDLSYPCSLYLDANSLVGDVLHQVLYAASEV